MGMGLIGIGQQQAGQATQGFGDVAKMETARNEQQKSIDTQKEAASQQMKGTLAAVGGMAGAMYASGASIAGGASMASAAALGPVGLGIAGGLILASLF